MTPQEFVETRIKWQRLFAEKPIEEIKAMLKTLLNVNRLTNYQRECLALDLDVLVTYKERMDFDKMMKGIQVHHDF